MSLGAKVKGSLPVMMDAQALLSLYRPGQEAQGTATLGVSGSFSHSESDAHYYAANSRFVTDAAAALRGQDSRGRIFTFESGKTQ
jgi:hypothetical protein